MSEKIQISALEYMEGDIADIFFKNKGVASDSSDHDDLPDSSLCKVRQGVSDKKLLGVIYYDSNGSKRCLTKKLLRKLQVGRQKVYMYQINPEWKIEDKVAYTTRYGQYGIEFGFESIVKFDYDGIDEHINIFCMTTENTIGALGSQTDLNPNNMRLGFYNSKTNASRKYCVYIYLNKYDHKVHVYMHNNNNSYVCDTTIPVSVISGQLYHLCVYIPSDTDNNLTYTYNNVKQSDGKILLYRLNAVTEEQISAENWQFLLKDAPIIKTATSYQTLYPSYSPLYSAVYNSTPNIKYIRRSNNLSGEYTYTTATQGSYGAIAWYNDGKNSTAETMQIGQLFGDASVDMPKGTSFEKAIILKIPSRSSNQQNYIKYNIDEKKFDARNSYTTAGKVNSSGDNIITITKDAEQSRTIQSYQYKYVDCDEGW